jgi:hypothetical protein
MKPSLYSFFLLFAAFFSLPQLAPGQCDSLLQVLSPSVVEIGGSPSAEGVFVVKFRVKSETNAAYSLSVSHLIDADNKVVVPENAVSVTPAVTVLKAGQTKDIELQFSGFTPGRLSGNLLFSPTSNDCDPISIPLHTVFYSLDQLVLQGDPVLIISTAKPSFLNFLIPSSQNQQELILVLENNGDYPYELADYSLSMIGKANGNAWTREGDTLTESGTAILSKREQVLKIPLASGDNISPDVYNGNLRLFFKGVKDPLKVQVQANLRGGVIGALLVLLAGILIGRMVRTLDESKDQMELLEKLYSLENGIKSIDDEVSRVFLLGEWNLLLEKTGKMEGPELRPELEEAIKTLKAKMAGIQELEILSAQTAKIGDQLPPEQLKLAYEKLVEARDYLLDGKTQEAADALAVWKEQVKVRSRGMTEAAGPDVLDSRNFEAIIRSLGVDEKKAEKEQGAWARVVQFLKNALQFLTGVGVGAQVKYWFFRPLILSLIFLFILFAGFKEIYLDGSTSFGSEGMADYLKLLLWGLGSDLFSRELIGTRLMGMKEKITAAPVA